MTYDSTLLDTLHTTKPAAELPACLKRDRLNTGYFAKITGAQLGVVVTLMAIFWWTSIHRLNHTDLWGHLSYGRWIAQHQSLPAIDPFTASSTPQQVAPTAWLSQLIGYETFALLGVDGLALGHALLAALACGLMIAAIRARGVDLCWSIAGGVAYYLLMLPIIGTIRPQLFGMVGAPLVLLAIALLPTRRWTLAWLPVVFAFWANLHGSFLMGLVMLGIVAVGETCRIFGEKRDFRATLTNVIVFRFWAAVGLSLLATTLNPIGPRLLVEVLDFGGHPALANIMEWRALRLVSMSGILFVVSLVLGGVSLWTTKRRWQLSDLLLLAVFGLATVSAMRMLAWWAAIWPWVILPYAMSAWEAKFGKTETQSEPNAMKTVWALGVIFMGLLVSPPSNHTILGQPREIGVVANKETPLYIADEIQRRHLQGTFFAPMDWSDYILWTQPDGLRPLVYSHVHLLPPQTWSDYQHISAGDTNWLALADKHHLRYLVVSKDRQKPLATLVVKYTGIKNSRATILYQDQKSMLVELRPAPETLAQK